MGEAAALLGPCCGTENKALILFHFLAFVLGMKKQTAITSATSLPPSQPPSLHLSADFKALALFIQSEVCWAIAMCQASRFTCKMHLKGADKLLFCWDLRIFIYLQERTFSYLLGHILAMLFFQD